MLTITIKGIEVYNEETEEFSIIGDDVTLELEHSLVSLSKWESKYNKPFLSATERTSEETSDYIKYMITTKDFDEECLQRLTKQDLEEIQAYIDSSQTATTFRATPNRGGRTEIISAELIYYWMFSCDIPIECETWHLNRLFTLIRVFSVKNSKQKPMPRHEIARQNQEINAARKAALGTSG